MSKWIENKRKILSLSQEEVAESLGISRPTYVKLEKGLIKPTALQKDILASLFTVSREVFDTESTGFYVKKDTIYPASVPKENIEKFKQVLLYIVSKVGGHPNIGQTALYKLLYFIDFDFYEKYQKYLVGATYIKNIHGPTPVSFAKISKSLQKEGRLVSVSNKYFKYDQTRYLTTSLPNLSLLSAVELKHIDEEIERFSNKNATELSSLSHKDTPWKVAEDKAVLNYRHVFYRTEETSVSDE